MQNVTVQTNFRKKITECVFFSIICIKNVRFKKIIKSIPLSVGYICSVYFSLGNIFFTCNIKMLFVKKLQRFFFCLKVKKYMYMFK